MIEGTRETKSASIIVYSNWRGIEGLLNGENLCSYFVSIGIDKDSNLGLWEARAKKVDSYYSIEETGDPDYRGLGDLARGIAVPDNRMFRQISIQPNSEEGREEVVKILDRRTRNIAKILSLRTGLGIRNQV